VTASILVLTAEESPCEEGERIRSAVYVEEYDGQFVWDMETEGCNEETPAEVEEVPMMSTETPETTST